MPEDPKEFVEKVASGEGFQGVDLEALEKIIQKRYSGDSFGDLSTFVDQCQLLKQEQ